MPRMLYIMQSDRGRKTMRLYAWAKYFYFRYENHIVKWLRFWFCISLKNFFFFHIFNLFLYSNYTWTNWEHFKRKYERFSISHRRRTTVVREKNNFFFFFSLLIKFVTKILFDGDFGVIICNKKNVSVPLLKNVNTKKTTAIEIDTNRVKA